MYSKNRPDVLAGLFTLAGFDQAETLSTIAPFASGCGSIVHYPMLEAKKNDPKAVLGMFDVSARPCVQKNTLSMAIPFKKFCNMIDYMEESFLITKSWMKVQKRI